MNGAQYVLDRKHHCSAEMTDEQFEAKLREIAAREKTDPARLFYLSFAENGFRGAVFVMACGPVDAWLRTNELGICPGGQMLAVDIDLDLAARVRDKYRNRLLLDPVEIEAAAEGAL